MSKKIIIIGGVAGGATTAARLRRLDEFAEIILIECGEYISFANCGLPYHIGKVIPSRDSLVVQTVEDMHQKFNIDIRNFSEVVDIDKKAKKVKVKKSFIEKMFGRMMPRGTQKLPISNMNMAGIGPKMIKGIMKKKNVDSLQTLMKTAMDMGVKVTACAMSMNIMGIKEEELIDGIEIAGVATYLGDTQEANHNLFI